MHKLSNIDYQNWTADCSLCGRVSVKKKTEILKNGHRRCICRNLVKQHKRTYNSGVNGRRSKLKRTLGIEIPIEIFKARNEAKCCEICRKPRQGRVLSLDHCHKTLKIRGFLCHQCNLGLGNFQDSPDILRKAIIYLNKNTL